MNLTADTLQSTLVDLIHTATCVLPTENQRAMENAFAREDEGTIGKIHLQTNLENLRLSVINDIPICGDTGFPVFFIRVGDVKNFSLVMVEQAIRKAVQIATHSGYVRPTVVDPLSRANPGTNVGKGSPVIEYKVDPDMDYCEIIYAPKGGGTEIFGPAFRTILVADGIKGIK